MYCFKSSAISATIISVLCLSGCSTTTSKAETNLKRAAIQRWTACLERHAAVDDMPAINKIIDYHCEGHKRDVLALYPRNMTGQVDDLLATNAYRIIDSMNQGKDRATQTSRQVPTVLR